MNANAAKHFHYIQTAPDLPALLAHLSRETRAALDTEADSLHNYYEKVCLMQLTLGRECYIIDPLRGLDLTEFLALLADRDLVLHGSDYDLRMMFTSYGFRPKREVFDTTLAAQLLGIPEFGLAALVEKFFNVKLSKQGQKSDWSQRPLTPEQLEYASDDTRYLLQLADLLAAELARLGRGDWHREWCERVAQASLLTRERDPDEVWRIKGAGLLDRRQLSFLKELWHWREGEARKADRPSFKIMTGELMLAIVNWATPKPGEEVPFPKLPRDCTGDRLTALEAAIKRAREMPAAQWPHRPRPSPRVFGPDRRPQSEFLRAECQRLGQDLGVTPSVIASRASLEAIARSSARTVEEIMAAGPLMRWQAGLVRLSVEEMHKKFQ